MARGSRWTRRWGKWQKARGMKHRAERPRRAENICRTCHGTGRVGDESPPRLWRQRQGCRDRRRCLRSVRRRRGGSRPARSGRNVFQICLPWPKKTVSSVEDMMRGKSCRVRGQPQSPLAPRVRWRLPLRAQPALPVTPPSSPGMPPVPPAPGPEIPPPRPEPGRSKLLAPAGHATQNRTSECGQPMSRPPVISLQSVTRIICAGC